MRKYKYIIFIILIAILILCIPFFSLKSKPLEYKPEKAILVYNLNEINKNIWGDLCKIWKKMIIIKLIKIF